VVDRKDLKTRSQIRPLPPLQFNSGATESLRDVAGSMFTLAGQVGGRLDELAQIEGGQEGLSGNLDSELLYAPTIRGQAYTKSAVQVATTKLEREARAKMTEFAGKYINEPAKFKEAMGVYTQELASILPEPMREPFTGYVGAMTLPVGVKLEQEATKRQMEVTRVQALSDERDLRLDVRNYSAGLLSDDPMTRAASQEAMANIIARQEAIYNSNVKDAHGNALPVFDLATQAHAAEVMRMDIMRSAVQGRFQDLPLDEMDEFIVGFKAGEIELPVADENGDVELVNMQDLITQKESDGMVDWMHATRNEGIAENKMINAEKVAAAAQRKAAYLSDTTLKVDSGEIGEQGIENAYREGKLTPTERTRLVKASRTFHAKGLTARNADGVVAFGIKNNAPVDFNKPENKAAHDRYYSSVIAPQLANDPRGYRQAIGKFVNDTGRIPSQVTGMLSSFVSSVNPEHVSQAVELYSVLAEEAPQLLGSLGATRGKLERLNRDIRAGMVPEEAIEIDRKILGKTDVEVAALKADVRTKETSELIVADLVTRMGDAGLKRDGLTPNFASINEREPSTALTSEYLASVERHYVAEGDMAIAQNLAWQDVNRVWGPSVLFALPEDNLIAPNRLVSEWVRYSPEKLYGGGRDTSWVVEQFRRETEALGPNIVLGVDPQTAREAKPSYLLWQQTELGLSPVMVNRTDVRATPGGSGRRALPLGKCTLDGCQNTSHRKGLKT